MRISYLSAALAIAVCSCALRAFFDPTTKRLSHLITANALCSR